MPTRNNYKKCIYPPCEGNIIPGRSKEFCSKHQEMFEFFVFMLNNVKVEDKSKTKSGLILP
jgi:hypothetical protein